MTTSRIEPADIAAPSGLAAAWQSRPWFGRVAGFSAPLDVHEVAGLALEEDVETLVVRSRRSRDHVSYDIDAEPLDTQRLADLGERDWTVLVRDIDLHLPDLRRLWDATHWLADWRRADIMVSLAAPGGSVGPHSDSYDVFLLQGQGLRRWSLAPRHHGTPEPGHPLRLVNCAQYTECITARSGDLLYVPPGHIHHGEAEDWCTTWSLGLQAPLLADIAALCDQPGTFPKDSRYRDPGLPAPARPGEIGPEVVAALAAQGIESPDAIVALGILVSHCKPEWTPAPGDAKPGAQLAPATRLFWHPRDDSISVFCNGQSLETGPCHAGALARMCAERRWHAGLDTTLGHWLGGCGAWERRV